MKRNICLCGVMFSALLCAETATYEWTQANGAESLGDGAVSAVWSGSKVQSFTKVASGDVAITGDSLDFAPGGIVSLNLGNLTFGLPITSEGALSFGAPIVDGDPGFYNGEPLSGLTEKKVFENLDLDEWSPFFCTYNKKDNDGLDCQILGDGTPFNVVRGEGTLSVQFQTWDGIWSKSVQVLFTQVGEDVNAKITHARYIADTTGVYFGADFETLSGVLNRYIAIDNEGKSGYSIDYIVFRKTPPAVVVVENSVTAAGAITNGTLVDLVFSGESALSESGDYAGDFYVKNKIIFKNRRDTPFTLTGSIEGDDSKALFFDPYEGEPKINEAGVASVTGTKTTVAGGVKYQYIGKEWMEVVSGVAISDVTNITGCVCGPYIPTAVEDPYVHFVSNSVNGLVKYYQFQLHDISGGWYKAIDVELMQIDDDKIGVRAVRGLCQYLTDIPVNDDGVKFGYLLTSENSYRDNYDISQYSVRSVTIAYRGNIQKTVSTINLKGTNYIQSGVIEVSGAADNPTCVKLHNLLALPKKGKLNVRENGIVEFCADGNTVHEGYGHGNGAKCEINVFPGGELRQAGRFIFGNNAYQTVNNTGGKIVFGYNKYTTSSDSETYLPTLNMKDGAILEGTHGPRVGHSLQAKWTSSGSVSNTVNCGIIMTGYNEGARQNFILDCDTDLVLNGTIEPYPNSDLMNCVAQKKGPAKVIQNGANLIMTAPIEVHEGTWVLGRNGLVLESKVFELHGGTLELADGVNQSFNTLPLMTNAVCGVTLGNASTLQLGALSFVDEGATLAVMGPAVNNGSRTGLRIGTSATLTESVLAKITYNDTGVIQDSEGWIRTIPDATMIILK